MRRLIEFPCAGETLSGSLDVPDGGSAGRAGLLIVSGGNEVRGGAHRGMASLAARLSASGHPVFRFDRRGIGDSTGENLGFEQSAPDIAAAAATFRAETGSVRLVAFGNCDAATALALFHATAELDALVLANPWALAETDDLPAAAAIRARYAERLRDPRAWLRLMRGGVNIRKLISGLSKLSRRARELPNDLAARLSRALADARIPVTIVLAERDATAIAFSDRWKIRDMPIHRIDTASHSFARETDQAALEEVIRSALAGV